MTGGIIGKIVRVDLSRSKVTTDEYSEEWLCKYLGGDALAARIMYDEVPPGVGPLDPENRLILITGPLAGTAVPGACDYSFVSKSPATGFTIYNSHSHGYFAPMLKFSGYDGVILQGKAEKPVYLWVHEGKAEIRDGTKLWGKDTSEAEDLLRKELGEQGLRCCSIGPAGEKLATVAGIVNDKGHLAARGGLGAVMGSKNLKAIAVYGTGKVPIANEEEFKKLAKEWQQVLLSQPGTQDLQKYGTASLFVPLAKFGDMVVMNYSRGELPGYEKLSAQNYIDNMFKRNLTCWGCPVAHLKLLELKDGEYAGRTCEMPELEIINAWGPNIGVTDPTVPPVLGELCDRMGLDSLGTANAVAWAMECYEKGIITKEDTDGLDIRFGNHKVAFQMIEKIAQREGFGNILANGSRRAAQWIGKGSESFVADCKNMAMPMHDHRAFWGYAFQYAVGSAGPAHEGGPSSIEMRGILPRFSVEGKAQAVKQGQEHRCFVNCLGVCMFGTFGVPIDLVTRTLSAAIGFEFTPADSQKLAMRAVNLRRVFNIRHGLTPADDTLSERFLQPPTEGGAKGSVINIKGMLWDYYRLMGWDHKSGKPYKKTLAELDLGDIAKDMWL